MQIIFQNIHNTLEEPWNGWKSMYGMTNSGKLFADELTEWLIEEGFMQSQFQMSIYYKYPPDGDVHLL